MPLDPTAEPVLRDRLRGMVGERVPTNGVETDTRFSTEEIDWFLTNVDTLNEAAVLAWQFKAAEFAELIDIAESGSARQMSQLYRHAKSQLDYFSWLVRTDLSNTLAHVQRAAKARAVAWAQPASQQLPSDRSDSDSSPWDDGQPRQVRPYPLHRFNQVKR